MESSETFAVMNALDVAINHGGIRVPIEIFDGKIMASLYDDIFSHNMGNLWQDLGQPANFMVAAQVGPMEGAPMVWAKVEGEDYVIMFNSFMAALAFASFLEILSGGAFARRTRTGSRAADRK